MYLAMSVTFVGSLGSTKAYTSVLSATGSLEISGASRCDDIASLLRDRDEPGDEPGVAANDLVCADHDDDLALPRVADIGDQRRGAAPDRTLRRGARAGEVAAGADQADGSGSGCRGLEKRASRIACHAFLPKTLCWSGRYLRDGAGQRITRHPTPRYGTGRRSDKRVLFVPTANPSSLASTPKRTRPTGSQREGRGYEPQAIPAVWWRDPRRARSRRPAHGVHEGEHAVVLSGHRREHRAHRPGRR